ncbi:MAG: glycosyltransferase family 4 protein [Chloroflexaceae bacterium]|nr:glycosyltransferase family 4 protein [Chloroflexaceae bacterium]NJO06237.1 glycosyltransferase family 4 protein [Chloroflexaceae bacterium]
MRVLFIARYRDATMHRKVELLRQHPDLAVTTVYPRYWRDELLTVQQAAQHDPSRITLAMLGNPADPHRALYRTLAFGMLRMRPHIIHAEEEPDSLAAVQIAAARLLFAPQARLLLHSWQNIIRPRALPVEAVYWLTLWASDGILCASREAVAVLRQHNYKQAAPVIPAVGVDTQVFVPREREPDPTHGLTIGYAGRLVPEKGVDVLITALQLLRADHRLPPVRLVLLGDGPTRPALVAQVLAAELGDRVEFAGAQPPAQVAQWLHSLHLLVLPSRTTPVWKEQFGRILVEAMASGVPVVGAQSGAIPEVIGDAGLTFPEGDAAALADGLHRLVVSPELRRVYARRGLAHVQQYTQTSLAARTAAFYRVLRHAAPPARVMRA